MHNAVLSEATAATAPDGDLLFGGGRHVYRFDAHCPHLSRADCNLRFTGINVRNRPVAAGAGFLFRPAATHSK